jgi:DNA helicase IV
MSQPRADAISPHADVAGEQAFLDHAYACLAAMRGRAVYLKGVGYQGGDVGEGGPSADTVAQWDQDKQRRIDLLAEPQSALCFGRIDRRDGERFYVGRRHVEDAEGEPVVTDWRTPAATPFYRATIADPMGLHLRRRFLVEGRHLVDVFDEDFDGPNARDAGAYVPDPLLAEVERARTGEMRDIVATIQAEQDVIIRSPLEECIVVQGGPGTGKTAVGLHRAAYLLYEHREFLERERLLIIGPNRIFLRYISQVLPSLGETASIQLTIDGLTGGRIRLRGSDRPNVARLKGDPRMIDVVRRAVYERLAPPAADIRVGTSFGAVTLRAADVAATFESALGQARPLNESRGVVREQLVELAWRWHTAKPTSDISEWAAFVGAARASRDLKTALDKAWPPLTAAEVVRRLFGNRSALKRATAGVLTAEERDLLYRKPAARLSQEPWTPADLAVLDEADALISGTPTKYGHVVVDEAQDLSALELRMLARRSRRGSMTILGDLAQATAPASQTAWDDVVEHLGVKVRVEELTVGYRVPAPIMDFANQLLPEAAPDVTPATSVRSRGEAPQVIVVAEAARATRAAAEVAELASSWAAVGVVAPDSVLDEVAEALSAAGVPFANGRTAAALGDHVTLLPPTSTKGLEFDAVLVVEPGRIASEEANGTRLLYVALTRAVQHLCIVHAEPLPLALAGQQTTL